MMMLFAKQKQRHRCREQMYGYQGGSGGITTNYNSVKIFEDGVNGSKQGGSVGNPVILWHNLEIAQKLSRDNFSMSHSQNSSYMDGWMDGQIDRQMDRQEENMSVVK